MAPGGVLPESAAELPGTSDVDVRPPLGDDGDVPLPGRVPGGVTNDGFMWPAPATGMADDKMAKLKKLYVSHCVEAYNDDHDVVESYLTNVKDIFKNTVVDFNKSKMEGISVVRTYNLPLDPTWDEDEIKNALFAFYDESVEPNTRFRHKMDVRIGGIVALFDEEGESDGGKYFYPCRNTTILPENESGEYGYISVGAVGEGREALESIRNVDMLQAMNKSRPDTRSKVAFLSNAHFSIFRSGGSLVGGEDESIDPGGSNDFDIFGGELSIPFVSPLPKALAASRFLINPRSSKGQNDCFWRALAKGLGRAKDARNAQREGEKLATEFVAWRKEKLGLNKPKVHNFLKGGLDILSKEKFSDTSVHFKYKCNISSVIAQVENCFNINLYLLSYDKMTLDMLEKKCLESANPHRPSPEQIRKHCCLQPFHVSCGKHGRIKLHLLLDGMKGGKVHCLIIKRVDAFASNFRCDSCNRFFTKWSNCVRHMKRSACLSRFVYPGGPFERQKMVWEKLMEENIDFSSSLSDGEQYPHMTNRITWDIESKTVPHPSEYVHTPKVTILNKHQAVSISVATNVKGHDPVKFFMNFDDPKQLFSDAYDYMCAIQETSEQEWHERMSPVYKILEEKIVRSGGRVRVTADRYNTMSTKVRNRLKWLCKKSRTEDDINKRCKLIPRSMQGFRPLHVDPRRKTKVKVSATFERSLCARVDMYTDESLVMNMTKSVQDIVDSVSQTDGEGQDQGQDQGQDGEKKTKVRMVTWQGKMREGLLRRLNCLLHQLKSYGATLPTFGFNSSRYDLGVLAEFFPSKMRLTKDSPSLTRGSDYENGVPFTFFSTKRNEIVNSQNYRTTLTERDIVNFKPNVIGQTNSYKCIKSMHGLKFLDLQNYVTAKTSLDQVVKNYEGSEVKGFFPYSVLTNAFDPDAPAKPEYETFNDNFVPLHRAKGNLLEKDWVNFTRKHYLKIAQCGVNHLAQMCLEDDTGETDSESMAHEHDYRERLRREYMDLWGYHSTENNQKRQVTVDDSVLVICNPQLESVVSGVENFHKGVVKVIEHEGLSTYGDYLEWYNNKDVTIMLPVIDKMTRNFQTMDPMIEVGVENVSLPNIARFLAHKSASENNGTFYLAKGDIEGNENERTMRRNLYGGASIIFNRFAEAYKTETQGGCLVKTIDTQDANALYSRCMQKAMPVGRSIHCYGPDVTNLENDSDEWVYKEIGRGQESLIEKGWISDVEDALLSIAREEHKAYAKLGLTDVYPDPRHMAKIHCRSSLGYDVRIGPFMPDGLRHREQFTNFEIKTYPQWARGVVYEFNGDFYHGKPSLIKKQKAKGKLRDVDFLVAKLVRTQEKLRYYLKMKYVVCSIWEGDYFKCNPLRAMGHLGRELPPFTRDYVVRDFQNKRSLSDLRGEKMRTLQSPYLFTKLLMNCFDVDDVLADVEPEIGLFGLAEVDLEPQPGHSFEEFGPIFAAGVKEGESVASLRGVKRVTKCMLTTPHLQCLCSIGIKITKVYKVWEFNKSPCFKDFVDRAVEERKKGDLPGGKMLQADLYKLVVNAAYGGLIQNKDKHSQISFFENEWDVCSEVNKPTFKDALQWTDTLYEVASNKDKVKQDVPVQLGKFILDYAKMHMLNFYFHVLRRFCDMDKIDLLSMDTDSFSMALSENSLDECVLPSEKEEWDTKVFPNWFVHRGCLKSKCRDSACNKRLPGPFKQEFRGDKFVGLSSKLFTIVSKDSSKDGEKVACKGLMKSRLHKDDSDRFESSLNRGEEFKVPWSTFQRKKADMLTVSAERNVSNKYSKREVCKDNEHRTVTWNDVFDCSTPPKKRKLWKERKKVLLVRKKASDKKLRKNTPVVVTPPPVVQAPPPPPPVQLTVPDPIDVLIQQKRLKAQLLRIQKVKERDAKVAKSRSAGEKSKDSFFLQLNDHRMPSFNEEDYSNFD